MPEQIVVQPKSGYDALVSQVVLHETGTTRLVLRPEFVRNAAEPEAGVHFTFVYQKKGKINTWEDAPPFRKGAMKAGEEVRLVLDARQTQELYHRLTMLKEVFSKFKGYWNHREFLVLETTKSGYSASSLPSVLQNLFTSGHGEIIFQELARFSPEELTRLSLLHVANERRRALQQFEKMLGSDLAESEWQKFFEANTWIFGYGLCYKFITPLGTEVQYRSKDYTGRGSQRGDYLMATAGDVRFTVLVEIKKPQTSLFGTKLYRNGAWSLSDELVGAVTQVQANCSSWAGEQSRTDLNRELLEKKGIFTHEPRGILVIGRTSECEGTLDKRSTFETFRRNLRNPEIITFDELYERAKFILSEKPDETPPSTPSQMDLEDDDVPF